MYKHTYDSHHSYVEFNASDNEYNKRRSKGIYENLLCRSCEDIIKAYEDYGKSILYDEVKPYIDKTKSGYVNKKYNYNLFKFFVLSLLWRASICTHTGFKSANLGKYEEELRLTLLNERETPVSLYPCLIYQTYIEDNPADGIFMEIYPSKSKYDGKTVYQFIADGLFFFIAVGTTSKKTFPEGSSISPDSLRVGYDQLTNIKSFNDLFVRVHHQGKFSVYDDQA